MRKKTDLEVLQMIKALPITPYDLIPAAIADIKTHLPYVRDAAMRQYFEQELDVEEGIFQHQTTFLPQNK